MLLPVINRTPLFPSNADFNQISSVWAKCEYWQDILGFRGSKTTPTYWTVTSLTSSWSPDFWKFRLHTRFQVVINGRKSRGLICPSYGSFLEGAHARLFSLSHLMPEFVIQLTSHVRFLSDLSINPATLSEIETPVFQALSILIFSIQRLLCIEIINLTFTYFWWIFLLYASVAEGDDMTGHSTPFSLRWGAVFGPKRPRLGLQLKRRERKGWFLIYFRPLVSWVFLPIFFFPPGLYLLRVAYERDRCKRSFLPLARDSNEQENKRDGEWKEVRADEA